MATNQGLYLLLHFSHIITDLITDQTLKYLSVILKAWPITTNHRTVKCGGSRFEHICNRKVSPSLVHYSCDYIAAYLEVQRTISGQFQVLFCSPHQCRPLYITRNERRKANATAVQENLQKSKNSLLWTSRGNKSPQAY